jgi:hypothetical protein
LTTIATFGLFRRLVLPLCARCHPINCRGTQRGLLFVAAPSKRSEMKQATIGRFFTNPSGAKASEKSAASPQAQSGSREALKSVNSLEKKRVREVMLQSKKTTCHDESDPSS